MGVDHGGFDILVAEEFLHGADTCPEPQVLGVVAVLEEVGGEGMPEGVWGDGFVYFGAAGGIFYGFLQGSFMDMVALYDTRFWIWGTGRRWEYILPGPLSIGIGVLSLQSIRQVDCSKAFRQVFFVLGFDLVEVEAQWFE